MRIERIEKRETIGGLEGLLGQPASKFASKLEALGREAKKKGFKPKLTLDHTVGPNARPVVEVEGVKIESKAEARDREKKQQAHSDSWAWRELVGMMEYFEKPLYDLFMRAREVQQAAHMAPTRALRKMSYNKVVIGARPVALRLQTIREELPYPLAEIWDDKDDPETLAALIRKKSESAKKRGYTKIWVQTQISEDEMRRIDHVSLRLCGQRKETAVEMQKRGKLLLVRLKMEQDKYMALRKRFEQQIDAVLTFAKTHAWPKGRIMAIPSEEDAKKARYSMRHIETRLMAKIVDKTKEE